MRHTTFLSGLLLLLAFAYCSEALAQDSLVHTKKGSYKMKKAADDLKNSLAKDDDEQTARQYEALAKELAAKGDHAKAEEYMKKALEIYTRLNKKDEIASASRGLARTQESQNKITPAIKNYQSAAEVTKDKNLEQANYNDANRLRNADNPKAQMDYAKSNANLFEQKGEKAEASNAYQQLAKTQLEQNNPKEAIETLEKAIKVTDKPEEQSNIGKEIIKAYVANDQPDKAIAVSEGLLNKARTQKDTEQQIVQLRELAHIYEQEKGAPKAEALLKEAYNLAIKSGNTMQAKASVLALAEFYAAQGKSQSSLDYYKDYINRLDTLIKTDSSLIDAKIFEVTEGRIRELEKERVLQNELMARKTRFNYVLMGSIMLMVLFLFLITRALYDIRIKNKKIALQSLRREMNPHFIFNSLNSVNQYIAENNELEANKYLTSYSSLMRNIMENSNKDFVTLSTEMDQLKKYLELEHQRFHDKFDYNIIIDDQLDPDVVMIPNMLIQPHLENAIWHGLRYKETKGKLKLQFRKKGTNIEVTIADNGIGLTKSKALKTQNQKVHQSRGITNTEERIGLLNDLYKTRVVLHMEEVKETQQSGTCITITMPLITKK
ncbi:MAG: histidine kinase [Taibaiella sp.]|jgi:tetratricopeptide (TPR) repeat protein